MHRSLALRIGFVLILFLSFAPAPSLIAEVPPQATAPVVSPPPDIFTGNVTVDLSSDIPGAAVHCTTDDSIPTSASPVCTSLDFVVTTPLRAITVAPGYLDSLPTAGLYVVEKENPPENRPDLSFNFPTDDLIVYSRVPVNFRFLPSDNIDKAYFTVNGELLGRAYSNGFGFFNYSWDTNPLPEGQYTLKAYVLDDFGNTYSTSTVAEVSKTVVVDHEVAACQPTSGVPASGVFGIKDPPTGGEDERAISELQTLGVQWVARDFDWSTIQPTPDEFNWWYPDNLVTWAHDAGIQILVTLNDTPDWVAQMPWSARYEFFRQFANAAAVRYKPGGVLAEREGWQDGYGVSHWELWNEPNKDGRGWDWPPNPQLYSTMMAYGNNGIRDADPSAVVVFGGLTDSGMVAGGFLDYTYTLGAKDCFDVLSFHPYSFLDDFQEPVDGLREIATPFGDGDKPIWFTEFGTISDRYRSEDLLQAYAQKSVVPAFFWFSLRDIVEPRNNWGFFYNDWTKKQPAYDTLKSLLANP